MRNKIVGEVLITPIVLCATFAFIYPFYKMFTQKNFAEMIFMGGMFITGVIMCLMFYAGLDILGINPYFKKKEDKLKGDENVKG